MTHIDITKDTVGRISTATHQIELDDGTKHDAIWMVGVGRPSDPESYMVYCVPMKRLLVKTELIDDVRTITATCKLDTIPWIPVATQ